MDWEKLETKLETVGTILKHAIDTGKLGIAIQINEPVSENLTDAISMINDAASDEYPIIETEAEKSGLLKVVLREPSFKRLGNL